jgi:hypothetical protein
MDYAGICNYYNCLNHKTAAAMGDFLRRITDLDYLQLLCFTIGFPKRDIDSSGAISMVNRHYLFE